VLDVAGGASLRVAGSDAFLKNTAKKYGDVFQKCGFVV
jgi:hypothetical protein